MFRRLVWAVNVWSRHQVGWPSPLQRTAPLRIPRPSAWVSDARYGVPTTLPTLHPHRRRRPPSPTRRQRAETSHFRQPHSRRARLVNMSYNACKAAAPAKAGRVETTKVDRERHSVSRPGSVTISFKNRCRLAVGMPFLQKFALIVWVRIPPGTLSEHCPANRSPPSPQEPN